MGTASQLLNKPQPIPHRIPRSENGAASHAWLCTETLWVVFTFILFIILGPFAAIAVVPAVMSLASQQKNGREPEMQEIAEV
jgi:hypothetical protein